MIDSSSRVLLVNIDSKLPNLALMQLSSYIKSHGGTASFSERHPTHAFISCIFPKNRHKAESARYMLDLENKECIRSGLTSRCIEIDIGGTGVSLTHSYLDDVERENLVPDYSLYPKMDYSLGFTSRGCNRNCHFCFVPEKEGKFRTTAHPSVFHNPAFKKIVLMDNNILLDKNWFFEVTDWIIENDLRVDFNQGLDIRLMDEDVAERIHCLRPIKLWRFAFDSLEYREAVDRGIGMLKDAGINLKNRVQFYIYVDGNDDFDSALERCNILRGHRVQPYIMVNGNLPVRWRDQKIKDLARWCRPWIFFGDSPFSEYERRGH